MIGSVKARHAAAKRDELRAIWEQKVLCSSGEAIKARRETATKRLLIEGEYSPTIRQIDVERAQLEEEMFIPWLAEKRASGFDRV